MNFINVKNLNYATLTKDNATGITYGTMKKIPGLVKLSVDPSSTTASYYGDGIKLEQISRLGEIKVSIQASTLDMATLAELLGHTYDAANGTLIASANDSAPYVGIAYQREKADGSSRYIKLFKIKFSLPKEEASSTDNNVSFQDQTIEGIALPLTNNSEWKTMLESTESNSAAISGFFTTMIGA